MRKLVYHALAALAFSATSVHAQDDAAELAAVIEDLVAANRILSDEGILAGYGHVSVRHPHDPEKYLLSRSLAPELVTAADIVEFDLDSVPTGAEGGFYLERFIHGEIYKARPDVQAVVHNHSPAVITFGIGSTPLQPVFHQAAWFLDGVPVWDYRDFGTADGALVHTPARGEALAVTLADRPAVLMRNHGVAVVGASLPMVVGRSIVMEENAQMQNAAVARGDEVVYLEQDEETEGSTFDRAWNLWKQRLAMGAR